jgi:YfiH family protein
MNTFLQPVWPAPKHIKAYTTLRQGGVSPPPYDQFNLADHVGDNRECVKANRTLLKNTLRLPQEPIWIKQTHSTLAIEALPQHTGKEADASFTHTANQICVVQTADCLPLLLCNRQGTHVAAIHAGWRGLLHGIIEETVKALHLPADEMLAWLGPAIGPTAFEVGNEVRDAFIKTDAYAVEAFIPHQDRWLANIYLLAKQRLHRLGIAPIYGGEYCTYSDKEHFFSYRRDGEKTGRMATLIWIDSSSVE